MIFERSNCGDSSCDDGDDDDTSTSQAKAAAAAVDNVDSNTTSNSQEAATAEFRKTIHLQFMYIQMEYCDKQTLRNAIDEGWFKQQDRIWTMFRQVFRDPADMFASIPLIAQLLSLHIYGP